MMKLMLFDPSIAILLFSTLVFSIFYSISLKDRSVMLPKSCKSLPNISYLQNYMEMHQIVISSIQNSKFRVQIAFGDEYDTEVFIKYYIPSIIKAKSNGVKLEIILPINTTVQKALENAGVTAIYPTAYSPRLNTQSVVTDDIAYILQASDTDISLFQLITFADCESSVNDIFGFVHYYYLSQTGQIPSVVPAESVSSASAISPIQVNGDSFFIFHNPDEYLSPLRISSRHIISSLTREPNTNEIKIYSFNPPLNSPYNEDKNGTHFSYYHKIKAILLQNKTQIKYLVSDEIVKLDESWCKSLAAFNNVKIRKYNSSYAGPNFIQNGNASYVFSHQIRNDFFNEYIALHVATNSSTVSHYLDELFDSTWENSIPISTSWNA